MKIPQIKSKPWLSDFLFILWAGGSALLCYSLVTALRKPFTAAAFSGIEVGGFDYKTIVTITQILGYLIAKFVGIKLISELKKEHRLWFIIGSVVSAELALILFGILPTPYNLFAMFLNGLSLGCMWGVIFTFIEGRRMTDILASLMGMSIVISSGTVKSMGLFVLNHFHVNEFWMPALIGGFAFPLIIALGWVLNLLPQPNDQDIELKTERFTLQADERWQIFKQYMPILSLLFVANLLMTILRDIKEDFLINIFDTSAYSDWVFAQVDSIVTLVILTIFGMMVWVKNNFKALSILLIGVSIASLGLAFISWNYDNLHLNPIVWLFVMSLGLYIPYLAFQTLFFDRFIACFRIRGNVGFFIALIDFIGYAGTVLVLIVKEFMHPNIDWLHFYNSFSTCIGITCALCSIGTLIFVIHYYKKSLIKEKHFKTAHAPIFYELELE